MFGRRKGKGEAIPEGQLQLVDFKGQDVRRILHDNEWYFSVVDMAETLTQSASPSRYWNELRVFLT